MKGSRREADLEKSHQRRGPTPAMRRPSAEENADFLTDLQRQAGNRAATDFIRSAGRSSQPVQRMFRPKFGGGGGGKGFNPRGLTIEIPQARQYNGAIPQDYSLGTYAKLSLATESFGLDVSMEWKSSTGNLQDLEQVSSSEGVNPKKATGVLAALGTHTSTWGQITTSHGRAPDMHGFPKTVATGPGTSVTHQLYLYKTPWSQQEQVAPNSGFKIKRFIEADPDRTGALQVRTQKYGAEVTIDQHTATAGAGNIEVTEPVPLPSGEQQNTTTS